MKFKTQKTNLKNVFLISRKDFQDKRGIFKKFYEKNDFKKLKLISSYNELNISISKRNVIRGMHYQVAPRSLVKLVTVLKGKILDVILCVNKKSPDYRKIFKILLSDKNNKMLYIPTGYAHGFKVISKEATVCYLSSKSYNLKYERTINYNSFGFDWKTVKPIISKKDQK